MKAFLIRDLLAAGRDSLTHEPGGSDPGQTVERFSPVCVASYAPASSSILEPLSQ